MSIVYNVTFVMTFKSQQEVCLVHVVWHTNVNCSFRAHVNCATE